MFGFGRSEGRAGSPRESGIPAVLRREVSRVLAGNAVALVKTPRKAVANAHGAVSRVADILGKANNAPNTALGLAVGLGGHVAGHAARAVSGRARETAAPRLALGNNAVEFMNNPAASLGAVTIGNTTIYFDERQHTYQGQQLGRLYLPSNIAGGAMGLMFDGRWHGDANWNERGPRANPARPWSSRPRR